MKRAEHHTYKRIHRTLEDQLKRKKMRSFLARFPGEFMFDLSFGRKLDGDLACNLLDQYFGLVKTVMGIRIMTLGLIVQTNRLETHAHIYAKGKDASLDKLDSTQKRQMENLWKPLGKPVLKGAHVEKLLNVAGALIYLTSERNLDLENYQLYFGLNRRATLRLMKMRKTYETPPFKAAKPAVPEIASPSAILPGKIPTEAIPLPVITSTEKAPLLTVDKVSTGEKTEELTVEQLIMVICEGTDCDPDEVIAGMPPPIDEKEFTSEQFLKEILEALHPTVPSIVEKPAALPEPVNPLEKLTPEKLMEEINEFWG